MGGPINPPPMAKHEINNPTVTMVEPHRPSSSVPSRASYRRRSPNLLLLLLLFLIHLLQSSATQVQSTATQLQQPFRPHGGLKKKTQMCITCKMVVDMGKQAAIAAKEMKKELEMNQAKSRKEQLKTKMAEKLAAKGKEETGDPSFMSPNPFILPKKEQNPKRAAKDKALMSCLGLPELVKKICLAKVKATMPPYAPSLEVKNPAKYAGEFDGQTPLPDMMSVRLSAKAKKGMMFPALGKGLLSDAEKEKKGGSLG
jgi:hypothetical protein